ncbi:MAG: hypothetical protein GC186_13870 [Rhodobacteraceae bacterium]|nr:hypothetical protein [Paracoccaceae bacterium]
MRRATLTCLCAALLAGCAQIPDLGPAGKAAVAPSGVYPALQPLPVIAASRATVTDAATLGQQAGATDARVTALRARAAGLTGAVLDPATIIRLNGALVPPPNG